MSTWSHHCRPTRGYLCWDPGLNLWHAGMRWVTGSVTLPDPVWVGGWAHVWALHLTLYGYESLHGEVISSKAHDRNHSKNISSDYIFIKQVSNIARRWEKSDLQEDTYVTMSHIEMILKVYEGPKKARSHVTFWTTRVSPSVRLGHSMGLHLTYKIKISIYG